MHTRFKKIIILNWEYGKCLFLFHFDDVFGYLISIFSFTIFVFSVASQVVPRYYDYVLWRSSKCVQLAFICFHMDSATAGAKIARKFIIPGKWKHANRARSQRKFIPFFLFLFTTESYVCSTVHCVRFGVVVVVDVVVSIFHPKQCSFFSAHKNLWIVVVVFPPRGQNQYSSLFYRVFCCCSGHFERADAQ